jgi:hypothetical protein
MRAAGLRGVRDRSTASYQKPITERAVQQGIPARSLDDNDLLRELASLHDTLRHGSDDALQRHNERTAELEKEYLRRYPDREVDPERLRAGARARPE